MNLSTTRYSWMLVLQMSILIVDLFVNSFSHSLVKAEQYSIILLVVYIFQDVCIIFAFMTLVISFFTTYAFQAGMGGLLFKRDSTTLYVISTYLCLTIALQYWSLSVRWDNPTQFNWPPGMNTLYVFQRSVSSMYYYLYKRSVLLMSDPQLISAVPAKNNQVGDAEIQLKSVNL